MAGLTHYCPSCGAFSWHDETAGARSWALLCPECETVARQHPHPSEPTGPAFPRDLVAHLVDRYTEVLLVADPPGADAEDPADEDQDLADEDEDLDYGDVGRDAGGDR